MEDIQLVASKVNGDNEIFYQIYSKLDEIGDKLDNLALVNKPNVDDDIAPDIMSLLQLPENLRCTALTLYELGEATAEDIAEITNKQRAVESAYLNDLAKMGYIQKKRVGRMVHFSIE